MYHWMMTTRKSFDNTVLPNSMELLLGCSRCALHFTQRKDSSQCTQEAPSPSHPENHMTPFHVLSLNFVLILILSFHELFPQVEFFQNQYTTFPLTDITHVFYTVTAYIWLETGDLCSTVIQTTWKVQLCISIFASVPSKCLGHVSNNANYCVSLLLLECNIQKDHMKVHAVIIWKLTWAFVLNMYKNSLQHFLVLNKLCSNDECARTDFSKMEGFIFHVCDRSSVCRVP